MYTGGLMFAKYAPAYFVKKEMIFFQNISLTSTVRLDTPWYGYSSYMVTVYNLEHTCSILLLDKQNLHARSMSAPSSEFLSSFNSSGILVVN